MSMQSTLDNLAAALTGIPNPLYPGWGTQNLNVLSRPVTMVNPDDFPLLIVSADWTRDFDFELHQGGGAHYHYWIAMHLFVAGQNTELDEAHRRLEPWPVLIINPILNWVLANADNFAVQINQSFMPHRWGYLPWGGVSDTYFGFKTSLWINEDVGRI